MPKCKVAIVTIIFHSHYTLQSFSQVMSLEISEALDLLFNARAGTRILCELLKQVSVHNAKQV
jgi:hypothetical protein